MEQDAVFEVLAKQAATDLMPLVQEFMRALGAEGKYPMPTVKITNQTASGWLGRCASSYFGDGTTLTKVESELHIQRSVLKDEKTLRRVVAHEVGHHVANCELVIGVPIQAAQEAMKQEGSHGAKFQEVSDRLNQIYGASFVTVTSDETFNVQHREVNLFVIAQAAHGEQEGKLEWCWSTQVPEKIVNIMVEWRNMGTGMVPYICRTSSPALVTPQAKAPNWKRVEFKNELQALREALDAFPNDFAMYASRVLKPTGQRPKTWTLVMANPYRFGSPRYQDDPTHLNAWATPRTLTESELHMLSQLTGYGIMVRHRRVKGEDDLFNTLKRLDMQDVANRHGHVDMETNAQWIQERLHDLWYGAKQEIGTPQKTAALDVSFVNENVGAYSGQADYVLRAMHAGQQVGYLRYCEFQGEPSVQMLEVQPQSRRQGVGRALLKHLQGLYPGTEINLGGTTDDGTHLVDSLQFKEEPSQHAEAFKEHEALVRERDQLQAVADTHQGPLTPEYHQQMKRLNTVEDRIWELEQEIWNTRPTKRLIAAQRTIYLDMDGVLADYMRGAEEAGVGPDEFHKQKGAFSNLELLPGALDALKKLQATSWRVCLLSKPSEDRPEEASAEKLEWAKRMLPFIDPRDIYLTDDKSKHGTEHDILVDDHPEWANAEDFPGTVIHFKGPETWEEVMTTIKKTPKAAGFWDADSERANYREDRYRAGEVQRDLRVYFNRLLNGLTVQPGGQNMTLRQFLTHNPVTSLFTSTDRSVRLVGNRLRAELLSYLKQNFTPQQIQQFEQEHGTNVTDWINRKVVAKKAVLFTKR